LRFGRGFGFGLLWALPWLDRLGGLWLGLGGLGLVIRIYQEAIPVSIRVGVVALVAALPLGG
jgi:hypothetical protein